VLVLLLAECRGNTRLRRCRPSSSSTISSPHWLWAVAAIAAAAALGLHHRGRALERFASAGLLARLVPGASAARRRLRAGLLVAASVCLVASLLDPRWGVSFEQVQQRGIDVVVVLDVSRSMTAADARPSRLEKARQLIGDLVDQLAGDRVALVIRRQRRRVPHDRLRVPAGPETAGPEMPLAVARATARVAPRLHRRRTRSSSCSLTADHWATLSR
jgi:hypothetical protein